MKSSQYWRERAAALAQEQVREDEALLRQIARGYERVQQDLDRDLAAFFARYAASQGLTMAQTRQLLNAAELENWRMTLDEFREKAKIGGYDKELEEAYLRSRISRLQALQTQVELRVQELYQSQRDLLTEHLAGRLQDTYYRTIFTLEQGLGVAVSFAQLDAPTVEKILTKPWLQSNFSARVWENRDRLINQLRTELARAFVRGDSLQKTSKELARTLGVARHRAETLVHTESAHYAAEARALSYAQTGVESYEFLASLDERTCAICGPLDGERFQVTQRQTGINWPPIHPRCRCTTVPKVEPLHSTRAARDPQTGKTIQVPDTMTYEQWKQGIATRSETGIIKLRENSVFPGEKQLLENAHETALVYDLSGKEIFRKEGGASSVVFTAYEGEILRGAVLSHNHPSNGPLSDSDIFGLWHFQMAEVRAVTTHGVFSVKQPAAWSIEPNAKELRKRFLYWQNHFYKPIERRLLSGRLTEDEADYLIQRLIMRRLSREYGFEMNLIEW